MNAHKVKLEALIRDGQSEAEIVVDFLDDYSVRRVVAKGKGTTTSELRKGGKLIEGVKTRPVTEKIEEILKIDYELFERAIYSEQNEIDYFLKMAQGKRKDKIDQLLGIDQFELARRNCVKLLNSMEGSVAEYEGMLKEFESVGAKEKGEIEKRVEKAVLDAEKKRKEFDGVEKEKAEVSKRLKEEEGRSNRFIQVNATLSGLEKREKELGKLAEKRPGLGRGELGKRILEIEKEVQKRSKLLGIYESGLEEGKRNVKERNGLLEALAKYGERDVLEELDAAKKGLKGKREDLTRLRARKEFLERSVSEVEGGTCPVCEREWTAGMRGKVKADRQAELAEVGLGVEKLAGELGVFEGKAGALEKEADTFEKANARLKELGAPGKDVEKLEGLAGEVREKNLKDSESLQKYRGGLEILKAVEELEEVRAEAAKRKAELEKLGFDEKGYDGLKREFNSVLEKWNKANGELVSLWTQRDSLRGELKRIEAQEEKVKSFGERLEKIKKGEELLAKFKNALLDVQEELRTEFVKGLNETMSELWESLYPYGDFSNVRLGVVGGDYVLQLKKGEWVNVEGIVSGGERSTAALVLRVGFALALAPHLKVLILDEPTHNLDEYGIRELGNVLREKIQDYVSQVFLITHEEKLEQAASGSLYRLERDKGKKEASKVSLVEGG